MAASTVLVQVNASLLVRENSNGTGKSNTIVSDGVDWANLQNAVDNQQVTEARLCLSPGANSVITLPAAMTTGHFVAWKASAKVDIALSFGTVINSSYGILEGDFTSISILVPIGYTEDVVVHLVITGS